LFHYVRAVFLNGLFPFVDPERPFPHLLGLVGVALQTFWPLVVATLISRLPDILPDEARAARKDSFAVPYASVVRMDILIFVSAALEVADLTRLALIPVVAAYFFPWTALRPGSRACRTPVVTA
jgi:hypothetical protein